MQGIIGGVKYVKRCVFKLPKEIKRYTINRKEFSADVAKQLFIHALSEKNYSNEYISAMDCYMNSLLAELTREYLKTWKNSPIDNEYVPTVWTCWWQGKSQMPPIVKACVKRMNEVFQKESIKCVVITKDNLSDYIEIPKYVTDKFNKKQIGFAHFADIIRWGLIARYGGIWLDACTFLCNDDPKVYINYSRKYFHTQKFSSPEVCPHEPCMGKWCNGYFMGQPNNLIAEYTYAGLLQYWKTQSAPFDYIFLDYIIRNGYREIPEFTEIIDTVSVNSEEFYDFRWKINETFSSAQYSKIMKKSDFYNISYKLRLNERDKNGNMTFYGYILSKYCD